MEDNLNVLESGRRPQFSGTWKMTSIIFKWKTTSTFLLMEDNLNVFQMEDEL
jgi:hypothetical protein